MKTLNNVLGSSLCVYTLYRGLYLYFLIFGVLIAAPKKTSIMFYLEKWIDGELYFKSTPTEEWWSPFTKEMYKERVIMLTKTLELCNTHLDNVNDRLKNIDEILKNKLVC